MIVFVLAIVAGTAAGLACGGKLGNIARLQLRTWWLVIGALAGQAVVAVLPAAVRPVVIVAVCGALVAWCAVNLGRPALVPGMGLLGAGVLANLVVIAANSGMPVSAAALRQAGLPANLDVARGFLYKHVAMATHHRLSFLGDRLPVAWARTVMSGGDVVMLVGIALVLWAATGPVRLPLARSPRAGAFPGG